MSALALGRVNVTDSSPLLAIGRAFLGDLAVGGRIS
jgi:hypothetical protein